MQSGKHPAEVTRATGMQPDVSGSPCIGWSLSGEPGSSDVAHPLDAAKLSFSAGGARGPALREREVTLVERMNE